jgi:Flp pilus assembly protein TadG
MLLSRPFRPRRAAADERGAALVITLLAMLTLMVVAGYAIDTAIWFVHGRHLQTQADAAALAAAQDFQCTPGTIDATVDTQIANTVHTYDGTGLSTPATSSPYNPQVSLQPTPATVYNATNHNLFSKLNTATYVNQTTPTDTGPLGAWTGSPCKDEAINVKMTETNLPSFFPFINPSYINKEAQVSIQSVAAFANALPLAIPSQAPSTMHATVIDEGNSNAAVGGGRIALTSLDGINWTGTYGGLTLNSTNITGPLGLQVDIGGGSTCGRQLNCYDSTSPNQGIVYSRVWSAGAVPGTGSSPAGPEVGDASLIQGSSNPCPLTGSVLSNFVSDSSNCNLQLSTTVYFAAGAQCGSTPNVSLTLSVSGGSSSAMTCSSATTQTPCPGSATLSCVATKWSSGNQSLGNDSPDGPNTFDVSYKQTYGTVGKNTCQTGSSNKCKADLGVVQRAFNGAFNTATYNNGSRSGPIIAATVTDSSGNEFISHQLDGTPVTLSVSVKILDLGAFTDVPASTPTAPGSPVTLHAGTNQGSYAISCGGNNGSSSFTQWMATGCPDQFAATTLSNPPACNTPQTPAICVTQNPGNGKGIEEGIDCRVNGLIGSGPFSCTPSTTCAYPNHWANGNTVEGILDQTPQDPRLVKVLIVDSNAWVGVTGSSTQTPIRYAATFYITGWSRTANKGPDPCTGTTTPTNPGSIPYTSDEDPGNTTNVLLGHFVKQTLVGATPGGNPCSSSFGDCVAILTR